MSQDADILIRPNVLGLHWNEFGKFDDLLQSGRDAAENALKSVMDVRPKEDHIFYNLFNCIK